MEYTYTSISPTSTNLYLKNFCSYFTFLKDWLDILVEHQHPRMQSTYATNRTFTTF